jgi:hypothetical protein
MSPSEKTFNEKLEDFKIAEKTGMRMQSQQLVSEINALDSSSRDMFSENDSSGIVKTLDNDEKTTSEDSYREDKQTKWNTQHEAILVEWADKAMCFKWMHNQAHAEYSIKNAWFTIPVIVMSTLTGTANFAQDRFPINMRLYVQVVIGAINIFAGIITTVQQFLKVSEYNEAHRISCLSWDKFYRNIKVELAKCPVERVSPQSMIRRYKDEYDRLMEISPPIHDNIIVKFKITFKKSLKKTNKRVTIPEICASYLETTDIQRNKWFKRIDPHEPMIFLDRPDETIQDSTASYQEMFDEYITQYAQINGREPTRIELEDYLKDNIPADYLEHIISTHIMNDKL